MTALSAEQTHHGHVAAAKGAIIGGIAGDAGKGAAAGAAGGALFCGMTKRPGKNTTAGEDVP